MFRREVVYVILFPPAYAALRPAGISSRTTNADSAGNAFRLDKCTLTCDGTTYDQCVNFLCTLIGIDRLCVSDKPCNIMFDQDTVSTEQFTGMANNIPCTECAKYFCERSLLIG